MRELAFGSRATDVVDPGRGCTADFGQRCIVKGRRFAGHRAGDFRGHGRAKLSKRVLQSGKQVMLSGKVQ